MRKISEHRYQESSGLYYEDFVVGDIYEHRPGRTVTLADNIWQCLLTMNQHPLHIDDKYAQETEFGQIVVSSALTFSIINGLTVSTLSMNAIANLGWDKVRLTHPVFVNDTLYAESRILSKRLSKSRQNQGIVSVETLGKNQNEQQVIIFERTFLVPMRSEK